MITVRTTTLESFRRLVSTEFGDEAELIAAVSGKPFEPNWMMRAGSEFHDLLANQSANVVRYGRDHEGESKREYRFDGEAVLASRRHVGEGLHEVFGSQRFEVRGEPVVVTGHVDWIRGLLVQDHKCKFSSPDPRDYEQSLQWRLYLAIFGADVFRYNLFHFADPSPEGYCHLKETVSFRFWRYPNLEADCREWLARFVDWLDSRRLTQCLAA